jgi:hypothetical protein
MNPALIRRSVDDLLEERDRELANTALHRLEAFDRRRGETKHEVGVERRTPDQARAAGSNLELPRLAFAVREVNGARRVFAQVLRGGDPGGLLGKEHRKPVGPLVGRLVSHTHPRPPGLRAPI